AVSANPVAIAPSVELLIAITPRTGCLPELNHAISVGGSRSSRATCSSGKFVCSVLNSKGQALDEMNREPFMGCPCSPRLITRADRKGTIISHLSAPHPLWQILSSRYDAC